MFPTKFPTKECKRGLKNVQTPVPALNRWAIFTMSLRDTASVAIVLISYNQFPSLVNDRETGNSTVESITNPICDVEDEINHA
jgi:hypothetical protein